MKRPRRRGVFSGASMASTTTLVTRSGAISRPWEGTFASQRIDGSRVFVRAHAAPLRNAHSEITGIVIMAREATRRGGQRASDRIGLLEPADVTTVQLALVSDAGKVSLTVAPVAALGPVFETTIV